MKNKLEIIERKEYQWRVGWANPIAHTDINPVVSELETIQEVRGSITPEYVVESAKNKSSVLHKCFVWDNDLAAHKWRLGQAAVLLRSIEIKIIKDGNPKIIRAFEISKKDNFSNKTEYISIDLITDANIDHIKNFIISDLNRAKKKLSQWDKFNKAIEYIDKAIEELQKESTETKKEETILLLAEG